MKAARRNTQRVNWDQMWIQESRFFSPGHEMLWEIPNMWGIEVLLPRPHVLPSPNAVELNAPCRKKAHELFHCFNMASP